jgi:hypothetical protein
MGCCLPVEKWRGERLERAKAQGRPQVLFTALISVVLLRRLQNITTLWFVVITSETTEDSFAGWHRHRHRHRHMLIWLLRSALLRIIIIWGPHCNCFFLFLVVAFDSNKALNCVVSIPNRISLKIIFFFYVFRF